MGFSEDFLWGTATASYQVEGAVTKDGRGKSIWDTFAHTPGKIMHGHTGDIACDQYHRYEQDVELMRQMNAGAYRFSIAWPRILPDGRGQPNARGLDYYKRLCDSLRSADVRPCATLYHWDLPQILQDEGGWPARDTTKYFADYAALCFRELGDYIDMWITLNEPFCSSIIGYLWGNHAPGHTDRIEAYRAIHHLLLAHGQAVQAFRAAGIKGQVGITLNMMTPRPATQRPEDQEAADRATDLGMRMFLDPLLGRGYPQRHVDAYPEVQMPIESGDMQTIAAGIDFLGVNFYWEDAISFSSEGAERFSVEPQHHPKTEMGWPITPHGFYRHLVRINEHIGGTLPLYVTENGCALPDQLTADQNACHDPLRIDYLRGHFQACLDAIEVGVPLKGYFIWTLLDNFEWSFGFTKRFGLIYCDYLTQRRIPKDSFYYFRDVIAGVEFR